MTTLDTANDFAVQRILYVLRYMSLYHLPPLADRDPAQNRLFIAARGEAGFVVAIEDLTSEQLRTLEQNYVRAGKTEGGIHSLYAVRLELKRRYPSPFDTRQVAQKIIALSGKAPDGLVTYGEIWKSFRPNEKWVGNNPQSIMSSTLGRVISYCVRNQLPILTVLVVQASNKKLSDDAIRNICHECRALGVDTGPSERGFIEQQVAAARALTAGELPEDLSA